MKALFNKIDKRELKKALYSDPQNRVTLSFYKYRPIESPQEFRDNIYLDWESWGVLGRVYISNEGVNAQISIEKSKLGGFKEFLQGSPFFEGTFFNLAVEDDGKSFFVLKVMVKKKIVADGIDEGGFDLSNCGQRLSAKQFNELTSKPDTIVVDMRNHYESEVGHFVNAICPSVDSFRESLPVVEKMISGKKSQNIILYCTGGIRCEKASAWFKHKGFQNVFQLEGGIINYYHQAKSQGLENKFLGKNFVFDERLGERISNDIISQCHQCGKPCDNHTNCKNDGCHLLFIQCEECSNKFQNCCSKKCQEIINLPIEEQKKLRRGVKNGPKVFKKGRANHLRVI